MDPSKVYMVRSAKGNDMLCVDNYLYHYEDRGTTSFRWVCNRRKDKALPCRSRIITALVDDVDPTKHVVQKVVGDHTHDKCTPCEISKAFERKRIANLSGDGCTLEHKAEKRKIRRMEEFEQSIRRDVKLEEPGEQDGEEAGTSSNWQKEEEKDDDDDVEWADWLLNEEELPKKKQIAKLKEETTQIKQENRKSTSPGAVSGGNMSFNFKPEQLYMLKTLYGRQIVCLDGFLYRLEGKSPTTGTFRWECVRRRTACKARLHTVRLPDGSHKVKQISGVDHVDAHTHGSYTLQQLKKLLLQNNITFTSEPVKRKVGRPRKNTAGKFEEVTYSSVNCKAQSFSEIIEECVEADSDSEDVLSTCPDKSSTKRRKTWPARNVSSRKKSNKSLDYTYELVDDPLDALNEGDTSETGVKKFTFLPSAKGNKVLCLDNFIYHFDSCSQTNGRSYWTCMLRRDKNYKCNGRITTEMAGAGHTIVKVSGEHKHPDGTLDIKRRLYKSVVAQKAKETKMKPREILNSTMTELGDDFKRIVAKSKETIERRIGRLRLRKQKTKSEEEQMADEQNDSSSSFASALESDDDQFEFANLPTKLEQMREAVSDKHLSQAELECFETVETPMEEEYGVSTYYAQEDNDYEDEQMLKDEDGSSQKQTWDISAADIKPVFKHGRKRKGEVDDIEPDMDITKVSKLRSAKGGDLLCVDGYIYHMKSGQQNARTYWTCIKCKDRELNCKSRVATVNTKDGIKVFKVTNLHSHPINEHDIKRRLYNELSKGIPNVTLKPYQVLERSLDELSKEYADIFANSKGAEQWHKKRSTPKRELKQQLQEGEGSTYNMSELYGNESIDFRSVMKLYAVSDGPPSLAVRMTLKALKIPYELVNVDYIAAQHMSEEYAKMNPQKEIPVLDDNGFFLPESIAIMQYLCDKYSPLSELYPKDATQRAVVNHRLCFNMGFYYASISAYAMAPIFFDYPRSEMGLKKVNNSLSVFETYLERAGTKYAAADHLTICDLALVSATMCLEGIGFDLSPFPLVRQWYETFKMDYPDLWQIANGGMQEIAEFEKNPPDLSHMNHPFHPTKKANA